jgi:hypothetical protein
MYLISRPAMRKIGCLALAALFCGGIGVLAEGADEPAPAATGLGATPEGDKLLKALETAEYQFAPAVKTAYLAYAKDQARRKIQAAGKELPADFLRWVDSDPLVQATVYGSRQDAANILLLLRSLEFDLGQDTVRKRYTQLALAAAVVFAKDGLQANIAPHPPVRLTIGGDPRHLVNAKDPKRELDLNDHIINFLNDNQVEDDGALSKREHVYPELRYDARGIAIPAPGFQPQVRRAAGGVKVFRSLYACDVLASPAWQQKFNEYMKAKGQNVQIECGDKLVHWNSHDMVTGEMNGKIDAAFNLFKKAYEAKGYLPAERDPTPTPGERCAYLIRNNEFLFPPMVKREWPRFPLVAPWPLLTILVADGQPLREREERWLAYRDKGEFIGYGEYIGSVAQQYNMQSARRLAPYPFTYGSIQMMFKDGGVCGTMGNIGARSNIITGIPSCTAGQPGHCCVITFGFDLKTRTFNCHGEQYATGGDAETFPHTPWYFGDIDAGRPMVYHQSVAWGVNCNLPGYLDALLAYQLYRQLPDDLRQKHGLAFLDSALARNPYSFLLVDAAQEVADSAPKQIMVWWKLRERLLMAGRMPGCPADGLYNQTIKKRLYEKLAKLPVPAKDIAAKIYRTLLEERCEDAALVANYQLAVEGLGALIARTQIQLRDHLGANRTPASCATLVALLNTTAAKIEDPEKKTKWAKELYQRCVGQENYFGEKDAITLDPAIEALATLAGEKVRSEDERMKSTLEQLLRCLQMSVSGRRDPEFCKLLAGRLAATGEQIKDEPLKRQWITALARTINGREFFITAPGKNAKPQRDPCADAIFKLLNPPPAGSKPG